MALIRGEQISGSVGSANQAVTASYALTASYVEGAASDSIISQNVTATVYPTGSIFLIKSGSTSFIQVDQTGSVTITSDASSVFLIKNQTGNSILAVSQSGIVVFATHSTEITSSAPNGGIYFTSSSFFVGLD